VAEYVADQVNWDLLYLTGCGYA